MVGDPTVAQLATEPAALWIAWCASAPVRWATTPS